MKIKGYEPLNFVKWAGGKGHLIHQIEQYLPKKIDRYFEPFIGGGAVFFYIMQKYQPQYAYISDINQNLMITYQVIRDDVEGLIQQLYRHQENHRKDFEKLGNQKAAKIHELNKKAKKIKRYLEECAAKPPKKPSLRHDAKPPKDSVDPRKASRRKGELQQVLDELKTLKNQKSKEDKFRIKIKLYQKLKLPLLSFI